MNNPFRTPIASLALALCLAATVPAGAHDDHDHDHPHPSTPAAAAPAKAPTGDSIDQEIHRWTLRTGERPEDAHAWTRLGDALMQRSRDHLSPDLLRRAEASFRRALSLDPRATSALVGLAWVANTRHDFVAGRRYAREAIALDPDLPEPYALLGDAAVEIGEYDEAFDHFQKALDLRPDLSSYARAAHLLWLTGNPRRAQALMHKAILAGGPHAENTAWCRAELGMMLFHDGALLAAERQLQTALAEAPRHPHVLTAMARLQMGRKQYRAAIDLCEQAQAAGPHLPALILLADLHHLHGDARNAEPVLKRILHLLEHHDHDPAEGAPPTEPHSHGNAELARVLADHDLDLDRALAEAETAYATFRNVQVTDTLAWCYYKKGRDQDAARTIRKALRFGTPDALILFHAGMIHARLGDRPSARKYLYQALSLNPAFHPAHAATAASMLNSLASVPAPDTNASASSPAAEPGGGS